MYKILLIEDDKGISRELEKLLTSWSFDTYVAKDFKNIAQEFTSSAPHIVLLDIALPYYNGFYWCTEIRKSSNVPIVFISSAADNMNMVMAMNMGGDDFIAKPFDTNVLMAKIHALLRRTYDFVTETNILQHKNAILNTNDATLSCENEKIELTKNEFRILHTLMQNKGIVVSREKLMEALWQKDIFVDENTLTVNINRLRKKLDSLGLEDFISTKFGMGYIVQ